jgi:hypothetical protein
LAIDFHTWRSLERDSELDREEAVELIVDAVEASVQHQGRT